MERRVSGWWRRGRQAVLAGSLLVLLSGCVNDGTSVKIDGREHALSLLREQPLFWEKRANLYLIVARMPDCQRRHELRPAAIGPNFRAEVYSPGPNTFIIRQGRYLYLVESETCAGFQVLKEEPPTGLGIELGAFNIRNDELVFSLAKPADEADAPAPARERRR